MLRVIFVTVPAMWLAIYEVYRFKEFLHASRGVEIHPLVYMLMLVVAASVAYEGTFWDVRRDMKAHARNANQRSN